MISQTQQQDPKISIVSRRFTILIIAFIILTQYTVQGAEFKKFNIWTDVTTIYFFNPNFRYDGDYGLRANLTDNNLILLYIRPSIRYSEWSWMQLHGGTALFNNFFKNAENLLELRPWLGLRFIWPRFVGLNISHYFRMEYRAFYLKVEQKWDSFFRGRYKLQISKNNFSIGSAKGFDAMASIELFEDMSSFSDGTFGDRFRINIGFGKRVIKNLRIDINYLFHSIRLGNGDLKLEDHVLRTRFFYNFNWPQDLI